MSANDPHAAAMAPRPRRARLMAGLFALAAAAWALSGFYFVQANERGVVRRFGRIVIADAPPGLHYALPWPLSRVDRPRTTEVRRVEIGFSERKRLLIEQDDIEAQARSYETDVLTGDTNIVKVTVILQFQVTDPARYLTRTVDPERLIRHAAHAVIVEFLAHTPVDDALSIAKGPLAEAIVKKAGSLLDEYGTGVSLLPANVQAIAVPKAVQNAFNEVTDAKNAAQTMKHTALQEADSRINRAQSDAFRRVQLAEAHRELRLAQAEGDADSFLKILEQYERAPTLTRARLLLSTFDQILPGLRKYVVAGKDGGPVHLRLLESETPSSPPRRQEEEAPRPYDL